MPYKIILQYIYLSFSRGLDTWALKSGSKSSSKATYKIKYLLEGIVSVSEHSERLKQEHDIVNENLAALNSAFHLISDIQVQTHSKGKLIERRASSSMHSVYTNSQFLSHGRRTRLSM